MHRRTCLLAAALAFAGCGSGGSSSEYAQAPTEYYPSGGAGGGSSGGELASAPAPAAMESRVSADSGSGYADEDVEEESDDSGGSGDVAARAPAAGPGRYAQMVPTPTPQQTGGGGAGAGQQQAQQTATDAQTGNAPLLIYTAEIYLSVYEVQQTQRAVVAIAQELHGFLSYQDDQKIIIRIPAASFRDALTRVEAVGDVTHRNIQATDVSEEFRDLGIRLRNAEAVRDRLETLLNQARNVAEALQVQNELARVTEEIERMKGRLRFLQDRLAFSTITVLFQPRPTDNIGEPDRFRLPFPWLDELGLPNLLNLRTE